MSLLSGFLIHIEFNRVLHISAELHTVLRLHMVVDRDDNIKIVVLRIMCLDMFANGFDIAVEQLCHLLAVEPYCLLINTQRILS